MIPNTSPINDSSSEDFNMALLKKWDLTPIFCTSGSPVVTIIIGSRQYCVTPHPDLTANSYEYNQATRRLKALGNSPSRADAPKKGGL